MDDLITTLLRSPDSYTDGDKDLIRKNEDKLNDEEKEKFKDWLHPQEETPIVEEPVEEEKEETKPPLVSKAEIESIIEDKKKEWDKANVSQKEQDKAEEQIREFFKEGELPKDWNHAGTRIANSAVQEALNQIKEHPEEYAKLFAPHIIKEQEAIKEAQTKKEKEEVAQANADLNKDAEALVKAGKIPVKDIANWKSDPQFKEVDSKVAAIAIKFGIPSYKAAFEIYSNIPVDQGGGLDMSTSRMKAQKRAAGMVGGSNGGTGAGKSRIDNKTLHATPMEKLIENY